MPLYQEPNVTQTQDIFQIFEFINNTSSNGLFFPVMLGVIWSILFMTGFANGREASRSLIFSSFVCTILGVLLTLMGLLNPNYLYFLIILVGFGMIWLRLETAPN